MSDINDWIVLGMLGQGPLAHLSPQNQFRRDADDHSRSPSHYSGSSIQSLVSSAPSWSTSMEPMMLSPVSSQMPVVATTQHLGPLKASTVMPDHPELKGFGQGGAVPTIDVSPYQHPLTVAIGETQETPPEPKKPTLLQSIKEWFYETKTESTTESMEGIEAAEDGEIEGPSTSEQSGTESDSVSPTESEQQLELAE